MRQVKWGVLGCGNIAHQFAQSIAKVDSGIIYAVASNTSNKAKLFAEQYDINHYYTGYNDLVNNENIDAIYIATPHSFHHQHTTLCLEHHKHVLCEKPLTINANQATELISSARDKQLFLMEAVWTRFLPAIEALQSMINEGVIGEIHTVKAHFGITGEFEPTHRLMNKKLAGGALLDLGIYPITLAHLVFNALPTTIKSSAVIGETGIDESSIYLFEYNQKQRAILSSSINDHAPTEAFISGSAGYIHIPNFLGAKEIHVYDKEGNKKTFNFPRMEKDNFVAEIEHSNQCILNQQVESPIHPLKNTLNMLNIMDNLREQWGLEYDEE